MPHVDLGPEARPPDATDNPWESLGGMVKSMALDAVALHFTQVAETPAGVRSSGPSGTGGTPGWVGGRSPIAGDDARERS